MYNSYLYNLIGKLVRINRGGPESSEGVLLAVKSDYIAVFVKHKGIVYYNLEHIKSITLLNKPTKFDKHPHIHQPHHKHKKSPTFLDVLRAKINRLVKINGGGPDSITGVLTQVHRDYIKLIENGEDVIIFTHHIKSFTPSLRFENKQKTEQKKEKR